MKRPLPHLQPHALRVVQVSQVPATRWRNGGGHTQELLAWPAAAAADWQLRISVATIAHDGPFSAYPGVQRWIAVLGGDGVLLDFNGRPVALSRSDEPLVFDGAQPPMARLRGTPTQDLNLMLRDDAGTGAMQRAVPGRPWHSAAPWRALFTVQAASLHIDGGEPLVLQPGTLAWADGTAHQHWLLQPKDGSADPGIQAAFWMHLTPHALSR